MKKIILFLIIGICNSIYSQQFPFCDGNNNPSSWPAIAPCDSFEHGNWILVFNDEFTSESIDTSLWYTCEDGWHRNHGDELQYYLDSNIKCENGLLKLIARNEPGNYPIYQWDNFGNPYIVYNYFNYTSGWIQTKTKFQYGLFEIRCKIPNDVLWPAFWLYGNEGEIDVFEFYYGENDNHRMDIHDWPTNGTHRSCPTNQISNNFYDDFHIFSLEWDEFKLIFRVDGVIKRIDYKFINMLSYGLYCCEDFIPAFYIENGLFPRGAETVRINLAVKAIDNTHPDLPSSLPASLDIDYIRIYKKSNPNKNSIINNYPDVEHSDVRTARFISTENNVSLQHNQCGIFVALDSIILSDGFSVTNGGTFIASITNNNSNNKHIYSNSNSNIHNIDLKGEDLINPIGEESCIIYPNPAHEKIIIELKEPIENYQSINVYNTSGSLLKQISNIVDNYIELNTKNLDPGVYILVIYLSNGEIISKKIIVQ